MATLKIVSDIDCKLYIDQEFICDLIANRLHKEEMETGAYMIDLISLSGAQTFDLIIDNENQQFLKRIEFKKMGTAQQETKEDFSKRSDLFFYNGIAKVEENGLFGYINSSYNWVVKPQFSKADDFIFETAIVEKKFENEEKIAIIDKEGKNVIGGWFDEILHIEDSQIVLRRAKEILVFNIDSRQLIEIFEVCGKIKENEPIPVSKRVGYNRRYGYIDKKGNEILPFIYESVSNFSGSGYAEVQRFGIKRFINKDGKICILNTIEEIEKKDQKFYLLDDKYEWCGRLETSVPDSLFLSGCYRLAVLENGKWGYSYLKDYSGHNSLQKMFSCEYDYPVSDSRYGYVIMKKGNLLCVVNLIDAKYARGDKKGEYVYGEMGKILFSIEAEELYPFNEVSSEWIDYGGYGGDENKYSLGNFVVKCNGKYGIVSKNGTYLLNCQYSDIYIQMQGEARKHDFVNSICIADKNGIKELINSKGEILSNLKAKEICFVGSFCKVQLNNKSNRYFLFDVQNRKLLSTAFDEIEFGNYKADVKYSGISISGHNDYIIKRDNLYGVINKEGRLIIDCIYDQILHIGHKSNEYGWAMDGYEVILNGKHGVFSEEGEQVLECIFDRIEEVPYPAGHGNVGYLTIQNDKYGYCSIDGKVLLNCEYDEITPVTLYNEEYIVKKEGKYALFNCNNVLATDFIYDEIFDEKTDYNDDDNEVKRTYKVRQGNKIGIINNLGETLVECKYDYLRRCSTKTFDMKERYEVGLNGNHGIVIEGDEVEVELKHESISDLGLYSNDIEVYTVSKNKKIAIMSKWSQELLTDYIYEIVNIISKDYHLLGFSVKSNGLWGFLDAKCQQVIECNYHSIYPIYDKTNNYNIIAFRVSYNDKEGAISYNGDIIVPIIYDCVLEESTETRTYVCYSNEIGSEFNEHEPFSALDILNKKEYKLKTTSMFDLSYWLKKIETES